MSSTAPAVRAWAAWRPWGGASAAAALALAGAVAAALSTRVGAVYAALAVLAVALLRLGSIRPGVATAVAGVLVWLVWPGTGMREIGLFAGLDLLAGGWSLFVLSRPRAGS